MPIKFLVLRGGGRGFFGRGGLKRQFYFYGRGDSSEFVNSEWKTDFYTVVVLILWRILLQNFQPQRQWCIKILLPWAQQFYTPLVLGRG